MQSEFMKLFLIVMGAVFVNNYVLAQFLGMCPFFGVSKKTETAFGMGISVLFVMTISSVLTYLCYRYILVPQNIEYLKTIVFILIIASIVQFIEVFMKKKLRRLYTMLGIYLPLITTNCAIFGVTLLNIREGNLSLLSTLANSIGAGVGFTLAIVLMAGIREKYENNNDIHKVFMGFPLALFTAGLMSIAFMGFQGII